VPGRDDEGNDPWDDGYTGGHDDAAGGYDEDPPWTEEDERRYQARRREELKRVRRRRRQATSFTVLVLLVLGIGLGAAGVYQGWWEWPFGEQEAAAPTSTGPPCPTPEVTAAPPAEVTVTVLNGKGEVGLAGTTAAELEARGFVIGTVDNAEAPVAEVAQVRHGQEAALQARTVAAQVPGAIVVNDGRAGTAVDLALGAGFEGLAPPEEAAAAIAPVPAESPAGCVPAVTPSEPPPATPPSETAPTTPAPTTTAPATTGG
jgi:hypothetical protein